MGQTLGAVFFSVGEHHNCEYINARPGSKLYLKKSLDIASY